MEGEQSEGGGWEITTLGAHYKVIKMENMGVSINYVGVSIYVIVQPNHPAG